MTVISQSDWFDLRYDRLTPEQAKGLKSAGISSEFVEREQTFTEIT